MKPIVACMVLAMAPAFGADLSRLGLKIVEGDAMSYAPGSRATRGLTIEVADEGGRLVAGAAVTFQLPETGPSGHFLNGTRSDIVHTGADGRATVWGMRWGKLAGAVEIRISAAKDGVRGSILSTQTIHGPESGPGGRIGRPQHGRLLLITLAIAGAAGAGIAAVALRGSKAGDVTTPATSTLSIGAPTVIVGAP